MDGFGSGVLRRALRANLHAALRSLETFRFNNNFSIARGVSGLYAWRACSRTGTHKSSETDLIEL